MHEPEELEYSTSNPRELKNFEALGIFLHLNKHRFKVVRSIVFCFLISKFVIFPEKNLVSISVRNTGHEVTEF